MKEGDVKFIKKTCLSEVCQECGEKATKKITYLYEEARINPASNGYGKDDLSWCSDDAAFSCEKHSDSIRRNPPRDMSWCAIFSRDRFEHMFLTWADEEIEDPAFLTPPQDGGSNG